MDKKKGIINVIVSIVFRILTTIGSLLVRRFLIKFLGNDVNGLNSLYLSIIGFLAIAELGVGSAVTFCMYKPIVEGRNEEVSALYRLFAKLYLIIGGIILVAGLVLMPFLKYLVADYSTLDQNIYLTFFLMLISVVVTYAYGAETSLINAYKYEFITATISSSGILLQYCLQILVLFVSKSFTWYLFCRIIAAAVCGILIIVVARKKFGYIIRDKQKLQIDTKANVTKNVKAMFMHKIGNVLVNTADSIIISAFIGVSALGYYTNYVAIMTTLVGIITLFFTPLTSVIGHMLVEDTSESAQNYLSFFHAFNFICGLVFMLGYYAIIDEVVQLFFGSAEIDLVMSKSVSVVITVNYFVQYMRQAVELFKNASGAFYYDRWKPIFEGVLNVGLSILFVCVFPSDMKIVGVIAATILTNLLICHIVEPHVLYKHTFKQSSIRYCLKNYTYILIFVICLTLLNFSLQTFDNLIVELLVNGCIAVAIAMVPTVLLFITNEQLRHYTKNYLNKIRLQFKRKTHSR